MCFRRTQDQTSIPVDEKSILLNTDYFSTNNSNQRSPDRLRILKSTLRTKTATSDDNINKFLSAGFKQNHFKNSSTESENSIIGGSVFNSSLRRKIEVTTLNTPQKDDLTVKQNFNTEKKEYNFENRYLKLK